VRAGDVGQNLVRQRETGGERGRTSIRQKRFDRGTGLGGKRQKNWNCLKGVDALSKEEGRGKKLVVLGDAGQRG